MPSFWRRRSRSCSGNTRRTGPGAGAVEGGAVVAARAEEVAVGAGRGDGTGAGSVEGEAGAEGEKGDIVEIKGAEVEIDGVRNRVSVQHQGGEKEVGKIIRVKKTRSQSEVLGREHLLLLLVPGCLLTYWEAGPSYLTELLFVVKKALSNLTGHEIIEVQKCYKSNKKMFISTNGIARLGLIID